MRGIRGAGIAVGVYAVAVLVWHFGGRTGHGHPWSQSWLGGLALAAAVGLWALVKRRWRKHRTHGEQS
ncbi:hypothetical protein [Actinacidiphila paucisporea]|uniref:Uncharacterized protein n=1 Tax=Actinacidiphila paucisporea TaxID=310782 RepID=A0A1M7QY61_9ACTN|nr:hypothetical protein [Actinacidiphila paucisporea]SHN36890.1 hypothetical protein SAMN05216499_14826 [Actinacidiphila paucisporea]